MNSFPFFFPYLCPLFNSKANSCWSARKQLAFSLPVSVETVAHKLSSSSPIFLENSLRSKRFCISYVVNYSILPQISKITINLDLSNASKVTVTFDLLEVVKWPVWEIYTYSQGGSANIKFEEQVHLLKKIPWNTLAQYVVRSWSDNYLTFDKFSYLQLRRGYNHQIWIESTQP